MRIARYFLDMGDRMTEVLIAKIDEDRRIPVCWGWREGLVGWQVVRSRYVICPEARWGLGTYQVLRRYQAGISLLYEDVPFRVWQLSEACSNFCAGNRWRWGKLNGTGIIELVGKGRLLNY